LLQKNASTNDEGGKKGEKTHQNAGRRVFFSSLGKKAFLGRRGENWTSDVVLGVGGGGVRRETGEDNRKRGGGR